MQHTKRWLAAVLAVTITLSDCGGMTVFATENDDTALSSISENDASLDETQSDQSDASEVKSEIYEEPNMELSALHIGQIKKGEELPSPKDSSFVYDLPVSFDTTDHLVLFVNYSIDSTLKSKENATVNWSILRGEKGSEPGSASLLNEEDDWTGFETVSASPFFVMEEITNEESEYYQMMAIAPAESSSAVDNIEGYGTGETPGKYDYYIRAAYYPAAEKGKAEAFYAAATVPFLPLNTDTEEIQYDTAAIEDTQSDSISDNTISTEDTAQEKMQEKETVDTTSSDIDADSADSLEEDSNSEQSTESVSENSAATEPLSALSETEDEGDAVSQPTKNSVGVLTLNAENVTLHSNDTLQIRATLEPENTDTEIIWTSSDDTIVSVSADTNSVEKKVDSSRIVNITALAAGTAEITAKCGSTDTTATVKVTVVEADENEVYDLSGDIWVSGFQRENEALVYTGQKVIQNFQVYHKETLLKEKTDYTLSYKNNINAAAWNSVKAPSVTITLKGQYQGSVTLYYTIYPADIKNLDIYNPTKGDPDENNDGEEAFSGYKQTINYSKNLKLPTPELTFGKKKLAVNKDFICDYTGLLAELEQNDYKKGDSYTPGKIYHYTVNGTGNFTGSIPMQLVLLKDKNLNFSSAALTLSQKQYEYHGTAPSKSEVTIAKLTINKKELDKELYDYEVYAEDINNAYIMVYPTAAGEAAGYFGYKKAALKLVGDRNIKGAALGKDWISEITFSQKTVNEAGGIFQYENGELLTFGETKEPLTGGQDYTVKYSNAKKVGTVTATFTGKGRYKGTFRQQYKIVPNTDKKNFTIHWKNVTRESNDLVITYQKGGAVPDFVLLDQDNNVLKNRTDYTVALTNNKTPGSSMICTITGKGNYKGYTETVQIMVKNGDISQCTLSVPDKAYSTKANAWKSKVTVKDVNGKTLAAGKDYEKEVTYSYTGMENEQPPAADTVVTVTVKGIGLYANTDAAKSSLTGSYRIFQNNISKLQIVIDNQEYTGKEITLSPEKHIHVYANASDKRAKKELPNATSCYQIVEYKNNIKAGTAKVTLQGIGEYGGTKTYSFKILKKAYLTNRVAKITLDQTKLNISLAEKEKRTLTATLTPKDASQKITNPTVIWSTSNSNIATVEAVNTATGDNTDTETDTKNDNIVTAAITVKKAGTVTITATTQDGNKKATCKITISVPTLKEKGQTIKRKTGETYQLSFVGFETQEMDTTGIEFESDNPTVASVNTHGLITMNRFGLAIITVYIGDRQSVEQCYVIVERSGDDEVINDSKILKYKQKEDCLDDTQAINNLLRQAEWSNGAYDTVYIPAGTYHIDTVSGLGGLVLTDNQNLIMSPDAKLVAIKNNSKYYRVIYAFGRSNVTISGGQIVGDRDEHNKASGGEWGHGIEISGCTNVYISDVEVSQCWGDGIYLGFYDGPNVCSNGVTIENCNLHHNRRNNLSITDVSNVTIRNCQFNNASGTAPQYGIDIEPNRNRTCSNVTISDSTFKGNAGGTIQILGQLNAHVKGVTIKNCKGDKKPVTWSGFGGSVKDVNIDNTNNWNG